LRLLRSPLHYTRAGSRGKVRPHTESPHTGGHMTTSEPPNFRPLSRQTSDYIEQVVEESLTPATQEAILAAYTATYDRLARETRSSADGRPLDPDRLRADVIPAFACARDTHVTT
jgi:hypothetical protein